MSMARLVDAVWGDNPPSTARKQIRNAASDLRNFLSDSGATITPAADGYQLDIAGADLDLRSFRRRVAEAREHLTSNRLTEAIAEYRCALALWGGPALSGLGSTALQAQVAGLNEERLSVLEECADLELDQGNHKALVSELSTWVAEYPLRERIVAQYLLALFRSGARARALTLYDRTRRTLAESLGLSPGAELQELHQQMLQEDENAAVSAQVPLVTGFGRCDLPLDIREFTGRRDALTELLVELPTADRRAGDRSSGQVVVIDGMGGAGKTTLAVHVAHRLASRYPDGQFFLDLQGRSADHDPVPLGTALRRLLRTTGLPDSEIPHSIEDMTTLWRYRLADRRVLLVLDNVASSEHIRPLLAGGPGCLTLVTSRRCLTNLTSAWLVSLDVLPRNEARELFYRLVGDRCPAPEPDRVDSVLEYCGYLPLAIVAAAARLRHRPTWPVSYLAARLAAPERRLAELQTESGGLVGCFLASYRYLSTEQQRLMRLLDLIPRREVDVESVSVLLDLPVIHAELLLEGLMDEHLLQQPRPGSYQMADLLRVYGTEMSNLIDSQDTRDAALKRMDEHGLTRASVPTCRISQGHVRAVLR